MAFERKNKDTLLNDLNKIKEIAELPSLYLSNYFMKLKNDVDREFAPKQLELQNDKEKKKELNELWQKKITKIDSFEKNCISKKYDLDVNKKKG
jgi:phosphoribosylformylglycinamidine (FGAM) synthase-like enzyme